MSDPTKGFEFQERDTSTPKNATSFMIFSEETALSMVGCFMGRDRHVETFQERETSSPKNATTFFISGELNDSTCGENQGKTDIFGNAISNQKQRGAL